MSVALYVYNAHGSKKMVSAPLELELQMVLSHKLMLEIVPGISEEQSVLLSACGAAFQTPYLKDF